MKLSIGFKLLLLIFFVAFPFFLVDIISHYYSTSMLTHCLVYIAVFVGSLIWGLFYIQSLYSSLKSLQNSTKIMAKGDLEQPITPSDNDEIGLLSDSMEDMRQSLLEAHQAMADSEKRYRELVETSRALLVTHDMNGQILSINKAACAILGYQPVDLIGKSFAEYMEPDVRPLFGLYREEIKNKGRASGLITLLHRDGHKEVWEFHNTLNLDNPNAPVVYVTGFHITERLKVENDLRRLEKRYRQIVEYSPIGINIHKEGKIAYVNLAAIDLLGYERPEELLDKPVREVIHPDDMAMSRKRAEEIKEKGQPLPLAELRLIRKDGSSAIVEVVTIPFSFNKKSAILSFLRDVTAYKEAEKSLKESEVHFQALFESIPEGVLVLDSETLQFLAVNDIMVERYGYSREEFLSMDATQIRPPEEVPKLREALNTKLRGSREFVGEYIHQKKDGGKFPVLIYRRKVQIKDRPAYVVVAVDNTERARVQKEMELLSRASEIFNSTLDIQQILDGVTKLTAEMLCDRCGVFFKAEGRNTLRLVSLYSRLNEDFKRTQDKLADLPHEMTDKYIDRTLMTGEPVLIEDTTTDDEWWDHFRSLSIGSYLAAPIKSKKKIWGVLACGCKDGSARLGERELEIATQLADRAAMAIENAGLFKDIELLEKKRHALFEHAGDAIFIYDTQGKIMEANQKACQSLGYTLPELIGMNTARIKSSKYSSQMEDVIASIIQKKTFIFEQEHQRKNGHTFPVEIIASLIELPDRPVIQSITRDISQRKAAEEELRAKTHMNAMLIDSLPCIAMLLKTNSREIVLSNRTGLEAGGYPEKHNCCFTSLLKREMPCPWCLAPEAWATGKTHHREVESSDGAAWDLYWIPLGPDQYIHYAFDITEKKKLEKQLVQAQKMEAIGQLAGGIAHDFNNILSGITGYTSLMKMKMDESSPFYNGISIIEKSAWRAAELTGQLLGFARGGKYEVRQIDLNKTVNNILGIISETFDRAIAINTSLSKNIWLIEGDAGQLEQVLLNICLNARDAMPVGGRLTIETSNITLDETFTKTHLGAKVGDHVMLTVSDTGTGISSEIQGKIFDPFFTTKEIGKGTGMGLAMVYGTVKHHEGYVSVYSEPGRGTCFKIFFPAMKTALQKKMKHTNHSLPTGTGNILLVDDEDVVREMGKTMLEELGYRVMVAENGQEACAVFMKRKKEIDLVLLDMIMPGMGGKETFMKLKEIDSEVKVLFCSGYSINGQAMNITKEGAKGFVQKPFNMQQLAQSVSEALRPT